jgi:acetaldehyde dehydrogenase (acetylating)
MVAAVTARRRSPTRRLWRASRQVRRPGPRANIDEFTQTTARGLERVGGAKKGKAIIVLNPAEPPLMMRNTVFCLVEDADLKRIEASVNQMADEVRAYVPGYRLKQAVQFEELSRPARRASTVSESSRVGRECRSFWKSKVPGTICRSMRAISTS